MDQVICHDGKTITVEIAALPRHLEIHHDTLGPCKTPAPSASPSTAIGTPAFPETHTAVTTSNPPELAETGPGDLGPSVLIAILLVAIGAGLLKRARHSCT